MSEVDVVEPVRRPGQFVKGHTIKSPGRPPKPKVDYLPILRECVTEEEHRAIVRRAIIDARNGSYRAREWLYKHLMPRFPSLSHHELSILEPEQRKNDGTDEASPEFRLFCDCCQTEDELHVFVKLYDRAQGVRSGKLMFDPRNTTQLIPAQAEKETEA